MVSGRCSRQNPQVYKNVRRRWVRRSSSPVGRLRGNRRSTPAIRPADPLANAQSPWQLLVAMQAHPYGASPPKPPYRENITAPPDSANRAPTAGGFLCAVTQGGVRSGPMAIPVAHSRKRGNSNWGRLIPLAPAHATEFERRVRQLQLTPEMYVLSRELRDWCWQNRNRCYVPEWLLGEWRITVDPNFSGAA